MLTHNVKAKDIQKKWVIVDATGQSVGRLASNIALVLRGKNKPTYTPHLDVGDNVIVINAEKVELKGGKWEKKVYYHHTGYIGGIKATRAADLREKYPDRIITKAVKGMLPKNKLSNKLLTNLRVYAGSEHPHTGQNPEPMAPRTAK